MKNRPCLGWSLHDGCEAWGVVSGLFASVWLAIAISAAAAVGAGGCAKIQSAPLADSGKGGTGGVRGLGGSGAGTSFPSVGTCVGKCKDFQGATIVDTGAPANAAGMFQGSPPSSGGPCVVEPEDGTMFPNNWLRPRVRFTGAAGKLVRITMEAPNQDSTLTAFTTSDTWVMPKETWSNLRFHQVNDQVTVTVWVQGGGASQVKFRTAPVGAAGNLVFWAAKPSEVDKNLDTNCSKDLTGQPAPSCYANDSELRGFAVGDETTISVLGIGQVQQVSKDNNNKPSKVRCIGCHAGVPGGDYVAFNDGWPWRGVVAGVSPTNVGMAPTYVTQGGIQDLWQPALGVMTFTPSHWMDGPPEDRIVITSYSLTSINQNDWYNAPHNARPSLVWFDLASPAVPLVAGNGNFTGDVANPLQIFPIMGVNMGQIVRTGDPRGGTTPNWSHDGMQIAYTSTDAALDGRLDNQPVPNPNPNNETHNAGHADIWTVPYNNRAGGTAKAVSGADTTTFEEYFPAFSPDDRYIAFNRVPAGEPMYANPHSEIAVVAATGDTAVVLRANTPPACTGKTSPGVNNHWAKWSPEVSAGAEGKFYWLVFSSNRSDIPPVQSSYGAKRSIQISQLYIAPVIVDETGIPHSYPAIYLWNQPKDTVNTTPAWETFQLPPVQ